MLPTLIIGLREGLEASLIVGIVAAFLRQQGATRALRQVWLGVTAAIVLCFGVAVALKVVDRDLPQAQQEGLETVIGVLAVAMVTYMVVWMRRNSRNLKAELHSATASALASGSAKALVLMAFLAVLREGLETAVFLLAAFNASTDTASAAGGAVLGIVIAVVLGYGIYRGGVSINLSRLFRATGLVLVLVAAGLLATAAHTGHEAGWVMFGQSEVVDLGWLVRPGTVLSSIATGVLGLQPRPVVIEVVGYLGYLVPFGLYVVWPQRPRRVVAATASVAAGLLLGGCSDEAVAAKDAPTVTVTLNDKGCALSSRTQPAGPVTFRVTNSGTSKVTEAEIMQGERILGEKENIAPGLDGSFTVTLKEGSYVLRCPGGGGPKNQTFAVTRGTVAGAVDAKGQAATAAYASYVRAEVAAGVVATKRLTDAVRAGDLAAAAAAYPASRVNWERIEPVAESFGGLDPAVDARLPDVPSVTAWTGYHRLEHAIFQTRSLTGLRPIADGLDANLRRLQSLVAKETYEVTTLANGASELLDEVATSKITGEEEAFSHVDLVDFQGNVDGARKAFDLLEPALTTRDAALATRIRAAFAGVDKGLAPYRTGSGPADFQRYTAVSAAERHTLAGLVDALAEPLSKVAAVLVRPAAS